MTSAILVHGLWHGGWTWDAVRPRLTAAGISSVAVDLPLTSLDDDIAVVRAALDAATEPVTLVAHSYGGAVITGVGAHPAVRCLVYLAAFQLDVGESVSRVRPDLDLPATRLGEAMRINGDDITLDPVLGRELLYHDAPRSVADAAMARVRPSSRQVFRDVPAHFAWRDLASSYVVCADDRVVAPELQRVMAQRATTRTELACGHSAPLVRPAEVAELIATAPDTQ